MIFAGIDYSLSSPCVCLYDDSLDIPFSFHACTFYVINDVKVQAVPNIHLIKQPKWTNPNERYHYLATQLLPYLKRASVIMIEDYAMRAKGRVFQIAENTEVLQYNLWLNKQPYSKIAPTALKKFASGKGNANKEKMHEAFTQQERVDLMKLLGAKNMESPVSDIVDAFFLCKYALINK